MHKIVPVAIGLLFLPFLLRAEADLPRRSDWLSTPNNVRLNYVQGYAEGFNQAYSELRAEEAGLKVGTAIREGKQPPPVEIKAYYPFKSEAVLRVMDKLYADPTNEKILWNNVAELALRSLAGEDISQRLALYRQQP